MTQVFEDTAPTATRTRDATFLHLHQSFFSGIIFVMRTTVTLDDDVAEIAAQYAQSRDLSLSKAIAELIVRGTRKAPRIKYVDGLPVFDLPKTRQPITSEQVKALEADQP